MFFWHNLPLLSSESSAALQFFFSNLSSEDIKFLHVWWSCNADKQNQSFLWKGPWKADFTSRMAKSFYIALSWSNSLLWVQIHLNSLASESKRMIECPIPGHLPRKHVHCDSRKAVFSQIFHHPTVHFTIKRKCMHSPWCRDLFLSFPELIHCQRNHQKLWLEKKRNKSLPWADLTSYWKRQKAVESLGDGQDIVTAVLYVNTCTWMSIQLYR